MPSTTNAPNHFLKSLSTSDRDMDLPSPPRGFVLEFDPNDKTSAVPQPYPASVGYLIRLLNRRLVVGADG
jgi:hypothetical protein